MKNAWPRLIACFQNRHFKGAQTVDGYQLTSRLTLFSHYLELNKVHIDDHYSKKWLADIQMLMQYHYMTEYR